jgi:capsular polysaccharide biosynthesis protein
LFPTAISSNHADMTATIDVPEAGGWSKARWVVRNIRPLLVRRLTTSATPLCGRELDIVPLAQAAETHGWPRIDLGSPAAAELWPALATSPGGAPTYPPRPFAVAMKDVLAVTYSRFVVPDEATLVADELWHVHRDPAAGLKIYTLDREPGSSRARLLHLRLARGRLPPSLHAMHEHGANYFHALVEVAPRIHLARQHPPFATLPILINGGMPASIQTLLRIVGGASPLIEMKPGLIQRVEELAFPSDVSFVQDVYDRPRRPEETIIHRDAVRAVVDHVIASLGHASATGERRLYLRRGGLVRRLTNEAEVEAHLVQRGFEVVQPGSLSLDEQVRLFREAAVIVAPTGAALTNVAWCRPGTRVIVIAADHPAMPNEVWEQLGAVSGAELAFVKGSPGSSGGLHDDFRVHLGDIDRAL